MTQSMSILPGSSIGMLGGGQLGRMFTMSARSMGYEVVILDPDENSPAGKLANRHLCADYTDEAVLAELASSCAVVTTEFENIPAGSLDFLEERAVVRPSSSAVSIAQDRILEKTFLKDNSIATAEFCVIHNQLDLQQACDQIQFPAILKVARFGYDGKGQVIVESIDDAQTAWNSLDNESCVLEQKVSLDKEVSIVLAREVSGKVTAYSAAENVHVNGILDMSIVPARIEAELIEQVNQIATRIAERLNYIGVMAVEFFISDGNVMVNEIAPRPHNSGHFTLDGCLTNQFEQQVRMVCGLPAGDTRLLAPTVMVNILGNAWKNDQPPPWEALLNHTNVKLNLYGKKQVRPTRKMGHFNVVSDSVEHALEIAKQVRDSFQI